MRQLLEQAQQQGDRPVHCYVPARIRYTLLAQLTPRRTWATATSTSTTSGSNSSGNTGSNAQHQQQQSRQSETKAKPIHNNNNNYSTILGYQENPLIIGSDSSVSRLIASTVWFTVESAQNIFNYAKNRIANCYYYESKQNFNAYHKYIQQQQYCIAYKYGIIHNILIQNYSIVINIMRSFSSIVFHLYYLIENIKIFQIILKTNNIFYNIQAVGFTLTRHICLLMRYILTSIQNGHLRGGCAYLLKCVSRIEVLLQVAPISLENMQNSLPRVLQSYNNTSSNDKMNIDEVNNLLTNTATIGIGSATRLKVKPEETNFEAGLSLAYRSQPTASSGTSSSAVAPAWSQKRVIPLDTTATQAVPVVPAGDTTTATAAGILDGETPFRRALAQPATVQASIALLYEMEGMASALLVLLSQDLHATLPEVSAAMTQKTATMRDRDTIPRALWSLGLPATTTSTASKTATGKGLAAGEKGLAGEDDLSRFAVPGMISSLQALEYVLGKDCKYYYYSSCTVY